MLSRDGGWCVCFAGQERLLNAIVRLGGFQHCAAMLGLNYRMKPRTPTLPAAAAPPAAAPVRSAAGRDLHRDLDLRPRSRQILADPGAGGSAKRVGAASGPQSSTARVEGGSAAPGFTPPGFSPPGTRSDGGGGGAAPLQGSRRVPVEPVEPSQMQQLSAEVRGFVLRAGGASGTHFPTGRELEAAGALRSGPSHQRHPCCSLPV